MANTTCVSGECVFLYDGFEDGTVSLWTPGPSNPATASVITTTAAQGTHSLLLVGGGTEINGLSVTLPGVKPGYVGWYVSAPVTNGNVGYFELTDASGQRLVYAWLDGIGRVEVTPGVGSGGGPGYQANTWVHIELENISWSTGKFDIRINGNVAQTGVGFTNFGPSSAVSKIYLFNSGNGTAGFDEILVK